MGNDRKNNDQLGGITRRSPEHQRAVEESRRSSGASKHRNLKKYHRKRDGKPGPDDQ